MSNINPNGFNDASIQLKNTLNGTGSLHRVKVFLYGEVSMVLNLYATNNTASRYKR